MGGGVALCRCAECRAGDALPVEKQGIPGARQLYLLAPAAGAQRRRKPVDFDKELMSLCGDRCAEFGEMPCYEAVPGCEPCGDCMVDAGMVPVVPLDPNAVIAPLL